MTARRGEGGSGRGRKADDSGGRKADASGSASASESQPGESAAPSFEIGLEQLEAIVDQLEQGELPLEEALAAFEHGVKLTRQCATQLDAADRRIEELTRESGEWLARPFEPQDLEGARENGDED